MRHLTRFNLMLVLAASVLVSPPALAQPVTPFLQACMPPGNGKDLSSDGCACNAASDCLGNCSATGICFEGPDVAMCAPSGNNLDLSSDGCPCSSNNDCKRVCSGASFTCVGHGGPAPSPACSRPGSGGDTGVEGCPCDTHSDCTGNCNMLTRTCGGIVGALANVPTDIVGAASEVAVLGDETFDEATTIGALSMPAQVIFELYGPGDATCGSAIFTYAVVVPGTGFARSPGFAPPTTGHYRWTATYSGNAWNLPSATACGDPLQRVRMIPLFAHGFE